MFDGIPDGSVVGPLLFSIFFNNISRMSGADDTVVFTNDANVNFVNASSMLPMAGPTTD